MAYLIFALCVASGLVLVIRWLLTADPAKAARVIRLALAGSVLLVGLFFMLTGRFALGLPLLLASAFLYRRLGGQFAMPQGLPGAGPSRGQTSTVETDYLRMELAHDSGEMRGTVRKGAYTGSELSALGLEELLDLLEECHEEDPQSAQLLETWLERAVGPDWRQRARQARPGGAWSDEGTRSGSGWGRHQGGASEEMSRDEAWEILGLEPGASNDEIKDAHRRLMLKNHPDRGGTSYIAARINRAKEMLLGE